MHIGDRLLIRNSQKIRELIVLDIAQSGECLKIRSLDDPESWWIRKRESNILDIVKDRNIGYIKLGESV